MISIIKICIIGGISLSIIDIEAYLDTPKHLKLAIEGLSPEDLIWKPSPTAWSVTEVLGHLADHNIVVSFRIRDLLSDTKVQLPAFNQDHWVGGQKTNEGQAADILALFSALLQYNSLLFNRLTEEDWKKSAVSHKGDPIQAADIVAGFTRHVHHHIGQIDRIKQALADSAHTETV
jgi:hypothetical protein